MRVEEFRKKIEKTIADFTETWQMYNPDLEYSEAEFLCMFDINYKLKWCKDIGVGEWVERTHKYTMHKKEWLGEDFVDNEIDNLEDKL